MEAPLGIALLNGAFLVRIFIIQHDCGHGGFFKNRHLSDWTGRALGILTLGMLIVMATTILLVLFERQPEMLVDHLYEAASAFATVGVSTGVTPRLSPPSQFVIIVTMFIGRVGPLTLLMGLGGRHADAHYDYPDERVTLG